MLKLELWICFIWVNNDWPKTRTYMRSCWIWWFCCFRCHGYQIFHTLKENVPKDAVQERISFQPSDDDSSDLPLFILLWLSPKNLVYWTFLMHGHKDCTNLLLYSKSLSCEGGLWGIGPPGAVLQVFGKQEGNIFLFLLLVCVCWPWSHATLAHVVFIAQSQISNWQNISIAWENPL